MTISFWLRPNHYGQVQINLVRPKPFWTDQNCFGHIEGQGIRPLRMVAKKLARNWRKTCNLFVVVTEYLIANNLSYIFDCFHLKDVGNKGRSFVLLQNI